MYLYPDVQGVLTGEIEIDDGWINGTYTLWAISPTDILGNTAYYYERDFQDNFSRTFIVNGNNDKKAPVLLSISTDKNEYSLWDTIEITAKAQDETNNDRLVLVFESENGDEKEITLTPTKGENLSGRCGIYGDWEESKYTLKSATAFDVVGNSKQYTPKDTEILKNVSFYVGEAHKYKKLNIANGSSQSVKISYPYDSFTISYGYDPITVTASVNGVLELSRTGTTMSSAGNYLTYEMRGKKEGNTVVRFYTSDSYELLDAYNVTVTPAVMPSNVSLDKKNLILDKG